jgi:hypothetical protein
VADADHQAPDVVKTLGQLVGLVAGALALVYAAGGGVLALRLYLADLPSRTVVGQLPRDLLISVGLAQIVLPAAGVAGLYAAARLLLWPTPAPRRFVRQWDERRWLELVAAGAIPALLVTTGMALGVDRERVGWSGLSWLLPVTFLLTLLVVLVALNVRARLAERYGDTERRWNTAGSVVRMSLVCALAFVPACVVFAGTIRLLDAKVCTTAGSTSEQSVQGVLIGETSDRTYIGQTKRPHKPLLVFSVPMSQITETFIGGDAGSRACPRGDSTAG